LWNGSVILAATAAAGGNWTGGAGTFNPGRNAYNATYTPAISEFGTTITLTWNLQDPDASGPCLNSTDAMTITVSNPAIANAGIDQAFCGNVSVTLAANAGVGGNWTGGNGIFSPDRTSPNATYSPALTEIGTTVTLTWNLPDPDGAGPCSASTDAMTITFSSAVTTNAGADQSICGGIPVTLNGNTVTGGNWTGGNGIFSPNRFAANATYTPAPSEIGNTITLTWNAPDPDGAGPCSSASDAMIITVSNSIAPNAGPDQIVCGATAIQLAANTATGGNWTGGNGTFNPTRTSANAILYSFLIRKWNCSYIDMEYS
jgi:hypothetical protein